jgi:hypothetical protein
MKLRYVRRHNFFTSTLSEWHVYLLYSRGCVSLDVPFDTHVLRFQVCVLRGRYDTCQDLSSLRRDASIPHPLARGPLGSVVLVLLFYSFFTPSVLTALTVLMLCLNYSAFLVLVRRPPLVRPFDSGHSTLASSTAL